MPMSKEIIILIHAIADTSTRDQLETAFGLGHVRHPIYIPDAIKALPEHLLESRRVAEEGSNFGTKPYHRNDGTFIYLNMIRFPQGDLWERNEYPHLHDGRQWIPRDVEVDIPDDEIPYLMQTFAMFSIKTPSNGSRLVLEHPYWKNVDFTLLFASYSELLDPHWRFETINYRDDNYAHFTLFQGMLEGDLMIRGKLFLPMDPPPHSPEQGIVLNTERIYSTVPFPLSLHPQVLQHGAPIHPCVLYYDTYVRNEDDDNDEEHNDEDNPSHLRSERNTIASLSI